MRRELLKSGLCFLHAVYDNTIIIGNQSCVNIKGILWRNAFHVCTHTHFLLDCVILFSCRVTRIVTVEVKKRIG